MPVNYQFDSKIVVVRAIGEYTVDELRAGFTDALSDSSCPNSPVLLIDMTQSRSIHARTSEEVRAMATYVASLADRFNNRIALVAPDDAVYGLMRMGSTGSEQRGVQSDVFRSFEQARHWLLSR